jgi:3-hydroxyisobutyrate dehydrogenase-like beta-hydroxyacid dehydrogenase
MTDSIGIFGLGLIGAALAGRLLAAGNAVRGYDPDAGRVSLFEEGGGVAADPGAVWRSDIVFSAVFDTDQLERLIDAAPHGTGGILVSMSTCDPERMAALEASAKQKGWILCEAPVSGTSAQLASGEAVFFIAGDAAATKRLSPLFAALGRAHFDLGAIGNGNRAKLVINLILGLNRAALAEGLVFAERLGLDPAAVLHLAQNSAAHSQVMATKGPLMVAGSFDAQGRVSQSLKDFAIIQKLAQGKNQRLPFAEIYQDMLKDCLDHAEGDFDNSAIILAIARARAEA